SLMFFPLVLHSCSLFVYLTSIVPPGVSMNTSWTDSYCISHASRSLPSILLFPILWHISSRNHVPAVPFDHIFYSETQNPSCFSPISMLEFLVPSSYFAASYDGMVQRIQQPRL
ncbi:hypothetical protein DL96DRAFT_1634234, partial [Flagelloscypha sp. PMI_526]